MDIVLHPRAAPGDLIRIWIGVFQVTSAPKLKWFLDHAETEPKAHREIRGARSDDMLSDGPVPVEKLRAFTGVYEFTGLQPDTLHIITVEADGMSKSIEVRTLPQKVPKLFEGSFNVLLVSCFHQHEDRDGVAGTIVSQLKATSKPHLTLLMGDQVYLDLPTLQNFQKDVVWLADKFEADYTTNWQGSPGYSQVLAAAPSISIPDDHEFWNNYPHPSPIIENSLSEEGRENWRKAALTLYESFQLPFPANPGEPVTIDVEPLSFFLPDMRSFRDEKREFTMRPDAHKAMDDWVKKVIENKYFGILVTGQSLFREPANELSGGVGDFEMPNYQDYEKIMKNLQELADAGRPALCLTGDVHWGRVVKAVDRKTDRPAFYEIIASPSSLVSAVGVDQVKKLGGFLGGLFGKSNQWPRHSNAAKPPDFLAQGILPKRFQCSMLHPQKGNHVALLKFYQQGGAIKLDISYWPMIAKSTERKPEVLETITLTAQ